MSKAWVSRVGMVALVSWLLVAAWGLDVTAAAASPPSEAVVQAAYGQPPLTFEANQGQVDAQVKFLARGKGYTLFLTPTESVMVLQQREAPAEQNPRALSDPTAFRKAGLINQAVVRMKLEGANPSPAINGIDQLPGIVNYFIGNDPATWRTKIPTYAKVQYYEAYPGIDLAYYGNQDQLEYDFIVAPGADPNQIKLAFEGASDIRVAESGDLLLTTELGEARLRKPIVYQLEKDGHKILVAGHYVLEAHAVSLHASRTTKYSVGFQLASYDHAKPVVIDPVLLYSTYLGGNNDDFGRGIAVDTAGQVYVTGQTWSTNFPMASPFDTTNDGNTDVFVTKLNAEGSGLLYSTYLGGSNLDDGRSIAVDAAGQAYVAGFTGSTNFPTVNPAQPAHGGGDDAFVTKLNAAGSSLLYSTYLGGSGYDEGFGIAVDATGQAYVTGQTQSTNFPTASPFQPTYGGDSDAFVTKLNAAGSGLLYSTYLGSSNSDHARSIAVDENGQAYVTGFTGSTDFPTVNSAQPATGGGGDAFVAKLNAVGSGLLYSTYLGGSGYEEGYGIAVDATGQAYVTGRTQSTNFPTVNPFQPVHAGSDDAFVTKLNAAGSGVLYSTYLGGSSSDRVNGISVDATGQAYVVGQTQSTNFPTASPFQPTRPGSEAVFVTKLNAEGSGLLYSTYLGGSADAQGYAIAVEATGQAYVTGTTRSTNFPTANPLQATNGGVQDAFVTKITFEVPFDDFDPHVKLRLGLLGNDDEFSIKTNLTLGTSSDGIAPLTESVTVHVGTFSTTIPPGSLILEKRGFTFEGVINGVNLVVVLQPLGPGNNYRFMVEGKGADLTGTVNPVTVVLTIGSDTGSKTVTAKIH